MTPEQKKSNRRMGLVLASIAAAFFLGFMLKMVLLAQ
ncbi:cytochrome oxidase small assembly protein [uncultured Ramlibacter sp.]|nr:cytochrome oxidase small assembly protein [uncultured Ramlibacter sp.]